MPERLSGRAPRSTGLASWRKGIAMSDLAKLESQILDQIAAANDEAALEAVRVAALGKKGSISALLATLGKMSPDERKTEDAKINLAKEPVTQAPPGLR